VQIYDALFKGNRWLVLARAAALIGAIALLDWRIVGAIPLGFLYMLPMLMVGSILEPWQIAIAAGLCTALAEWFDDFPWNPRAGSSRDLLYFCAFFGAGVFMREVNRNRRAVIRHMEEIQSASEARREAEEQLRVLVESSPAAILTSEVSGSILMANHAAHSMLAAEPGSLPGKSIYRYLPSLRHVPAPETSQQLFRATMQAHGRREDGEGFLADICFSTYRTESGSRLAAMVLDSSEEFRSHEVAGLQQLMTASRIAIGAVSHEIRNICGAIAVVHQNLSRTHPLNQSRDFDTLGSLISALERIAAMSLQRATSEAAEVDLAALLEELRIVVVPMLEEEDIAAHWQLEKDIPLVWADRGGLMQVFLNLITNSIRALKDTTAKSISITAQRQGNRVLIEFQDNGCGIAQPELLFQPFQTGAKSSGLGLYLSRAMLRSFGGEIRCQAEASGAHFIVALSPIEGQVP
jgi:two-component system sensor kinase FixL